MYFLIYASSTTRHLGERELIDLDRWRLPGERLRRRQHTGSPFWRADRETW
jgi:hypothetical protein